MDEPTAALAVKEVRKVLDLIKDLRTHGIAVILISVMALFHGRNFAEAPLSAGPARAGRPSSSYDD